MSIVQLDSNQLLQIVIIKRPYFFNEKKLMIENSVIYNVR